MAMQGNPQLIGLGRQIGEYVQRQSGHRCNIQSLQGVVADLASDMPDLKAPLRDLVARQSFPSLFPHVLSGNGVLQRDALIQEVSNIYSPELLSQIEQVLNGLLGMSSDVAPPFQSAVEGLADSDSRPVKHVKISTARMLIGIIIIGLLSAILSVLVLDSRKEQASPVSDSIQSEDLSESEVPRAEQLASEKVDAAIFVVQDWVNAMSDMDDQRASQYMAGEAKRMYDPSFFRQFDRVNVSRLSVDSVSGSFVNLSGVMTFVYPDGSVQKETRTFTVLAKDGSAVVTNTEFGRVIQPR